MGISSPKVGYTGYVASNTTLQNDTTEYSTTSTSGVSKITGTWIEDVAAGSKIRFKADLKKAGGGSTWLYLYIGGVQITSFNENNVAYQSHTTDLTVSWHRGDAIDIRLKSTVAGTAYVDNVEFCADPSPIILA